jgi:hypothetical protein
VPILIYILDDRVTLALAVVLPLRIAPVHMIEASASGIATTVIGVTIFVFAAMAYFVRQRDRLQKNRMICCTTSSLTTSPGG